jgi:hypothetical protein
MLGIVNAKRIWAENRAFWQAHPTPLEQEIVFASTGVKQPELDPCTYVSALAGDGHPDQSPRHLTCRQRSKANLLQATRSAAASRSAGRA